MADNVEKLGDRLRVPSNPKTQIGRNEGELLTVVNAVAFGITEFDEALTGEYSAVAPIREIASFLEGAYAVTRYISGDEPTHPMLANILRVFQQHGQEPLGSGRQER